MCNFNSLSEKDKQICHEKILECANSIGGKNFFLQLVENIQDSKTEPLISTSKYFKSNVGKIVWNKVIFNDKILLLKKISKEFKTNLLANKNDKKVFNLIRTLSPVEFIVKPKNSEDGDGFSFRVFDAISESNVEIDLVFGALFLCSASKVKQILNYDKKA